MTRRKARRLELPCGCTIVTHAIEKFCAKHEAEYGERHERARHDHEHRMLAKAAELFDREEANILVTKEDQDQFIEHLRRHAP